MHTHSDSAFHVHVARKLCLGQRFNWRQSLDVILPGGVLALLVISFALLPFILPLPAPVGGNVLDAHLPPLSPGHVFGTDANGNDVASRILSGGRTSLVIAISVNLIGLIGGGTLGALSAWWGGNIDAVIMRILDAFIAIPSLVLVLAVAQALEPGVSNIIWALAFFSVPAFARLARAATLRLRELPFITAAQLSGTGTFGIIARHVAPSILPQLIAYGLLGMGTVINIEGAVSFLGLGVPPPHPTWGNMIFQGQMTLSVTPWQVLVPSFFLLLTVLSFNLLSEALRARWSTL